MDIRQITDRYFVSPQITPEDAPAIRDAGISMVICNRPDEEVPPSHQAAAMRSALEAAGVRFEVLPVTHPTMTPDKITQQAAFLDMADGPVLAYCASGTRSSIIWALGQARHQDPDAILNAVARAGYDLRALRPTLSAAQSQ